MGGDGESILQLWARLHVIRGSHRVGGGFDGWMTIDILDLAAVYVDLKVHLLDALYVLLAVHHGLPSPPR